MCHDQTRETKGQGVQVILTLNKVQNQLVRHTEARKLSVANTTPEQVIAKDRPPQTSSDHNHSQTADQGRNAGSQRSGSPYRRYPDTTSTSGVTMYGRPRFSRFFRFRRGQRPINILFLCGSSFSDSSWVLSHRLWAISAASASCRALRNQRALSAGSAWRPCCPSCECTYGVLILNSTTLPLSNSPWHSRTSHPFPPATNIMNTSMRTKSCRSPEQINSSIQSLHSPASSIASSIPISPCITLSPDNKLRPRTLKQHSADGFCTLLSLITKSVPRGSTHEVVPLRPVFQPSTLSVLPGLRFLKLDVQWEPLAIMTFGEVCESRRALFDENGGKTTRSGVWNIAPGRECTDIWRRG